MVDHQSNESAPDPAIEVSILGPLEVRRDGAVARLPGRRPGQLLVDLVLAAGRRVATDVLVDHMWGEAPPASATKTIHKYVSELRRALGGGLDGVLVTDGPGYVLRLPPEAVDARRFEALVADARRLPDAGAVEALEEAESLWRGAALDEFADLDWAQPSAQRLEELRLTANERRLGLLVALGRASDALPELEQLVIEQPLREELCAQLMLAAGHAGRRGDSLAAYQRLRRSLADELGIEPSSRLREIEQQILDGEVAVRSASTDAARPASNRRRGTTPTTAPSRRGRLPIPFSTFVGRSDLLGRVHDALTNARLVTLTGPGGSGKTRVAVEVARSAGGRLAPDWLFVDLSVVDAGELVVRAIADADGLQDQPATDVSVLVQESLSSRPTVLILDNCEHLLGAVADLAATLLSTCPDLTILATSREPLGISGEQVRPIPPLDLPDDGAATADVADSEAVQLFAARAGEADPSFELDDNNRDVVADVCRRLDGMPLAELAAAQMAAMSAADIAGRLDDRFRLLGSTAGRPPRQATLRAAIDWSHGLLTADEQRLFLRLSVFPADFDAPSAAAVGDADDADVLLVGLVRRSMVARSDDVAGRARYRLLDTLRAYGRERLAERGDDDAARVAHTRHFAALARRAVEARVDRGDRWHLAITADYENVRAALAFAVEHDRELAGQMVFGLSRYWTRTDQVVDGLRYVEQLLDSTDLTEEQRAPVLCCAAELRAEHGEAVVAQREAGEALAMFDLLGDELGAARARFALGRSRGNGGDYGPAIELMEQARAFFADTDQVRFATGGIAVGYLRLDLGEYDEAAERFGETLRWADRHGMDFIAAKALWLLGATARHRGDLAEARDRCERALTAFTELDDRSAVAHVRMTLGDIARLADDREWAASLYSAAFEALSDIGDRRCTASVMKNLADLERPSDPGAAAALYVQCLVRRQALGDRSGAAEALEGLAGALVDAGSAVVAARLLAQADTIRSETGSVAPEVERGGVEATRERLAAVLPAGELTDALSAGSMMSLDDAIDAADAVMVADAPLAASRR